MGGSADRPRDFYGRNNSVCDGEKSFPLVTIIVRPFFGSKGQKLDRSATINTIPLERHLVVELSKAKGSRAV